MPCMNQGKAGGVYQVKIYVMMAKLLPQGWGVWLGGRTHVCIICARPWVLSLETLPYHCYTAKQERKQSQLGNGAPYCIVSYHETGIQGKLVYLN